MISRFLNMNILSEYKILTENEQLFGVKKPHGYHLDIICSLKLMVF